MERYSFGVKLKAFSSKVKSVGEAVYILQLSDVATMQNVISALEAQEISNIVLAETKYSKRDALESELGVEAIKKAKDSKILERYLEVLIPEVIYEELIKSIPLLTKSWEAKDENDPGIVLLKALTAIADKLNYNIDKNTLEAFMPSATQEESMRKLTEMMGYTMKHYYSATGKATITYKSSNENPITDFSMGIYFPKYINLKNEDEDINYVTLEDFTIQKDQDSREISIIEGELLECETNNDNIIPILFLSCNRFNK